MHESALVTGLRRWKVTGAYDGTDYCGWQVQANGTAVQSVIESNLAEVLQQPVRIHGSGRTDAGVHARGQVFHFDAAWRHGGERLLRAMQCRLPPDIRLTQMLEVQDSFHARFSATGKRYCYRLYLGDAPPHLTRYYWSLHEGYRIDLDRLRVALCQLVGWNDFRAFAANRGKPYLNTWRCITLADLKVKGRCLHLAFEGNGFLYRMVRGLTGAVLATAQGKLGEDDLTAMLVGEPRSAFAVTVPAQGLTLEQVFYGARRYPQPPSAALLDGSAEDDEA
jgi:tRNA pseudouridine38-40 synthase